MAEDIYVFEDQGWYGLVALDGGYLLVYFLLGYDVTLGSCEGYSVGSLSVPDVFFLTIYYFIFKYIFYIYHWSKSHRAKSNSDI